MRRTILVLAALLGVAPALAQGGAEQPKPGEPTGRPLSETPVAAPEVVVPDVLPPPAPSVQPEAEGGAAKTSDRVPAEPKN